MTSPIDAARNLIDLANDLGVGQDLTITADGEQIVIGYDVTGDESTRHTSAESAEDAIREYAADDEDEPDTYTARAECLRCGDQSVRVIPEDEGSDTQTATDGCPRCGSRDVRDLGESAAAE